MTWAPCFLASCAASTCFWLIDSLPPVQLACSSAPRTILGISALTVQLPARRRERTPAALGLRRARSGYLWALPTDYARRSERHGSTSDATRRVTPSSNAP